MTIAAIPTAYRGISYRSRLEARWAAFFDQIGWTHSYEPFDGNGYIPDFLIHGDHPFLVEVKPALSEDEYRAPIPKVDAALQGVWEKDVLIVGLTPFATQLDDTHWSGPPVGIFGDASWGRMQGRMPRDWELGLWMTCGKCKSPAIRHETQSFASRPCGHYDGDNFIEEIGEKFISDSWALATNLARWRP
jgi:hypothetical protein